MNKMTRFFTKSARRVFDLVMGNGLMQDENTAEGGEVFITPGMPELLRSVAAQGAVLLENSVLPFASGSKVAVFGRVQCDWFCFGYGSGGDVNFPYSVGLLEALRRCEHLTPEEKTASVYETWVRENPADHGVWGRWPGFHPEMPVTPQLVRQAKQNADQAVIVIGRSSGEDRENALEPGSYYLTAEEKQMLKAVTAAFPQAVLVLNIGSIIDLSFVFINSRISSIPLPFTALITNTVKPDSLYISAIRSASSGSISFFVITITGSILLNSAIEMSLSTVERTGDGEAAAMVTNM